MVVGMTIQQTWLFQGLQVMKNITVVSVISRTISVVMIFLLIKNTEQVYLYCALYSLTFLLMGIISALLVEFRYKIHFKKIKFADILHELKDGWYLFTTSAMSKIFGSIGVTVLVITSTESAVGVYSAIQKIPLIITMLYGPVGQVIYPYVSKQYADSFESGTKIITKIIKLVIPAISCISLIMIVSSRFIVDLLYGKDYAVYSLVLVPLIFWMILSILNNLLGIQILVASGHLKEYSIAFRIGVIAILLFNIIFGGFGGMFGVAIAAMLAELVLTIAILLQIKKIKSNKAV